MMLTLLNRIRGMYGWASKPIGFLFGLIVFFVTNNYYVAILCTIGYILGESMGWGEWVGNLTTHRKNKTDTLEDEGAKNGIKYIATKLVPSWNVAFIKYCRIALGIRGLYWWSLALLPLFYVSTLPLVAIILLGVSFPLACEIGYFSSKLWNFKHMNGGWEHSEVWYGLMQDVVLISLLILI